MTTKRTDILAELEQYAPVPNLGPEEFTRADIEEKYGISKNRASGWAKEMVAAGRLEKFTRYDTRINRPVNAWRVVDIPCQETP